MGGFGVGFKAGSMALAQTAVVLSRGMLRDKQTLSIGVLSNKPYETNNAEPPTAEHATIDIRSGEPIDGQLIPF